MCMWKERWRSRQFWQVQRSLLLEWQVMLAGTSHCRQAGRLVGGRRGRRGMVVLGGLEGKLRCSCPASDEKDAVLEGTAADREVPDEFRCRRGFSGSGEVMGTRLAEKRIAGSLPRFDLFDSSSFQRCLRVSTIIAKTRDATNNSKRVWAKDEEGQRAWKICQRFGDAAQTLV